MSTSNNTYQGYSKVHPEQVSQGNYAEYYHDNLSDNPSSYQNQIPSANDSFEKKPTPKNSQISPNLAGTIAVSEAFVILYFGWVGGVTCIGWAVVLNSIDYFDAMYPSADVSFLFPLAPYVAQFVLTLVITHLSSAVSYNKRIVVPLLIVMTIVMLCPFQALYLQDTTFGVVTIMGLLLVIGFLDNIAYASVAGLTSQIAGKYSAYYLIGVASFGLAMNGVKGIINLSFPNAQKSDILPIIIYFACTIAFIGMGLLMHVRFIKSDFYAKAVHAAESHGDSEADEGLLRPKKSKRDFNTMWIVLQRNWLHALLLILACIQLNMVHPGVMLKKPIPGLSDDNKTVTMIATFSSTFIVGKFIGQYRKYYNKYTIVVVVLFRFLLEGFFFIQALTLSIPVFNTVWFGYLNIGMYGITMGVVMVSVFILAPEEVSKDKKEISGFISVIACNIGSLAGGFLALPFKHIHIIDQ